MPDKCVLGYRCGTSYPTHPTVAEGVVTRTVYFSFYGHCCQLSYIIKVKNYSSYYVYELQKAPNWGLHYCGNAGTGKLH